MNNNMILRYAAAAATAVIIAVTNPLFSRNGATALFFVGDIPYTLEALVYGAVFAEMLMASLLWAGFSRRIMPRLAYEIDVDGEVTVSNDSRDFYRAVDYTPIVEYFQEVVATTIRTEWKAELDYLKQYDRMRQAMRRIVDLPEKKANQFIKFVQQNGGELAQRKREFFAELTDDEIVRLERVINGAEEPVA